MRCELPSGPPRLSGTPTASISVRPTSPVTGAGSPMGSAEVSSNRSMSRTSVVGVPERRS